MLLAQKWIKKMWYIYTMEYCTAVLLKFAGKLMGLKNIILREVTQTQKTNIICTHSYVAFTHKVQITNLQFTITEDIDNNEAPKRNTH